MPICGKDSNFKGKKNRSGRYSVADEALKNRVKHKAWLKTEEEMDKNIAGQIVLKDMTVKADIMSGGQRIANVDLFDYVQYLENKNNHGNKEDSKPDQADKNNPGGDIGVEDL